MVYGHLTKPIQIRQGCPQGDPSSPLLFLLSQQPFQDLLLVRDIFIPVYFPHHRVEIESQGYANDEDAMVNSTAQHHRLQAAWSLYNRTANSRMNVPKLRILALTPSEAPPVNTHRLVSLGLASAQHGWRSAYVPQNDEFMMVGFPIRGDGSPHLHSLAPLLRSICKRAGFWSLQHLSIQGRSRVANSLLTFKIWHAIQLCPLHPDILSGLKQILFNFVLASRLQYLPWRTLTMPRKLGGLGILDPHDMSCAMLGRTIAKVLVKATTPVIRTNFPELLLPVLEHEGSKRLSDPGGLYYWICRRGNHGASGPSRTPSPRFWNASRRH